MKDLNSSKKKRKSPKRVIQIEPENEGYQAEVNIVSHGEDQSRSRVLAVGSQIEDINRRIESLYTEYNGMQNQRSEGNLMQPLLQQSHQKPPKRYGK